MKLSASALSFSLCLTLSSACKAEPPAGLEPSTETPPVAAQPDVRADTLQDRLEQLTATDPDGDTALPITVNGETLPHPVWQATLMPGESLDLVGETPVALAVDDAEPASLANTHQYTAPDTPGVHQLRLFDKALLLRRCSGSHRPARLGRCHVSECHCIAQSFGMRCSPIL